MLPPASTLGPSGPREAPLPRLSPALSSRSHGHYGLPDVCLSLPTIVNDSGAAALVQMALTEKEMGQLRDSAQVLRGMLDEAGF